MSEEYTGQASLQVIATDKILVPESILRQPQLKKANFAELEAAIIAERAAGGGINGILESLLVAPSEEKPGFYELQNGMQRLTIAQRNGIQHVPVMISAGSSVDKLARQAQTNLHFVPTAPAAYGRLIDNWMREDRDLEVPTIAARLGKSVAWVKARKQLTKLSPAIQDLVDAGEINLTNAVQLAKLPAEEQANYLGKAQGETTQEFMDQVTARIQTLKDEAKKGNKVKASEFIASPKRRSDAEMKLEFETHSVRAIMVSDSTMTASEGFDLAIAWALTMDPRTVEILRENWESERKAAAEKKEAMKKDLAAKKEAAEAAERAALTK